MRPMPHRYCQHLPRRSHLQIKGNGKGRHQRRNIVVANMPPILAKVRCDAVRPGRCGCQGRLYRVGMIAPARVANSRHMVDIDTKTKGAGIGHRLTPFGYLASPAQWKPVPAAGCRSEEHTSELQSLMRTSYAVFCLKTHKNLTHTKSLLTSG